MLVADGRGLPIGVLTAPANPHESTLAEPTLRTVRVPRAKRGRPKSKPKRLIADKAYDSQKLRTSLANRGIDLIAPHQRTRKHKAQDGRKLRRYRKRWKVERTFAWVQAFRRLWTRHEHEITVYRGFLHIALMLICLRRL